MNQTLFATVFEKFTGSERFHQKEKTGAQALLDQKRNSYYDQTPFTTVPENLYLPARSHLKWRTRVRDPVGSRGDVLPQIYDQTPFVTVSENLYNAIRFHQKEKAGVNRPWWIRKESTTMIRNHLE